jgi:hypothetical protein
LIIHFFGYPLRGKLIGAGNTANGIYTVVTAYAKNAGIEADCLGVHGLRATAITNAMEQKADIAKAQAWLGYASISTIMIYDRRENRPEHSPNDYSRSRTEYMRGGTSR